ncbi:MAG TPA: hypothetical protein GXX69_09265 [Firmicutes bacterium]|jgi:hypothetical protein|nr:hypothetical protein [Bacillota bacterium]
MAGDQEKKKQGLTLTVPEGKVDCSAIERKLGTSLGPLLDAFSLGLSDEKAAELAEVSEHDVRELRAKLGQVGSSLGLSFKKPICQNKKEQPE